MQRTFFAIGNIHFIVEFTTTKRGARALIYLISRQNRNMRELVGKSGVGKDGVGEPGIIL